MSGSVAYLDSSAILKLVLAEAESDALRAWTDDRETVTSCALARTEVLRAVRRFDADVHARARSVLDGLDLLSIDDEILDSAATLDPDVLRSLDAIHLAAARSLGDDLSAIVTYDDRMLEGARLLGLPTERPGSPATPEGGEADQIT